MGENERWFLRGDRVRSVRVDDPWRGLEGTVTATHPLIVAYDDAGARREDPRDMELVRPARAGDMTRRARARAPPGGAPRAEHNERTNDRNERNER